MKFVPRLLFALVLVSLSIVLIGAGAVAFLIGSETGNRLLRDRTQATISRLLGPGYVSDLGQQTFEIRTDGTLAVGWNGVTLSRADEPDNRTDIRHVAFAIRLLPLAGGGLEFGRLEIEGARVNVEPLFEGRERRGFSSLSEMTNGAVEALERQLGALNAFRFETVAFENITIDGLPAAPGGLQNVHVDFAELRRSGSGMLDVSAALALGPMPLSLTGEAAFAERGRLETLSLRSGPAALGQIIPPGALEDPEGDRPFATDVDLSVTLGVSRAPDTGRLVSDLYLTSGPGALQIGRNRTRIEEARLRLQHREGEDMLRIVESPMRFSGVSFDVAGELEPVAEDASHLAYSIAVPRLRSVVGASTSQADPVDGTLAAKGTIDTQTGSLALSELLFESGGSRLSGTGRLDLSRPDGRSRLDLVGENLRAGTVKAFWPFNLAGRARHWVLDNVGDEGAVPRATIELDVSRDRFKGAFGRDGHIRPEEMRIALDVEDADVTPPGDLPRVYRGNGRVLVEGGRTQIFVEDAMVENHPAVALGGSTLTLERAPDTELRETLLTLQIAAAGAVPDLLAIADARPIGALRALPFEPADATGTAQVDAFARLRLGDTVAPGDLLEDWSVTGELMDATLLVPIEGRNFSNLTGSVNVDPGAARAKLTGLLDEIPAEISLAMPVGPAPSVQRLVEIDLEVSDQKAVEIVPALRGSIDGPLSARLVQDSSGLTAKLDLTRTTLSIPTLAWTKGRGVPGTVDVDVVQENGETRLRGLRIGGPGFSAAGDATIDGNGLRSARLTDVSLNPGDSVSLAMDRTGNGFSMRVEGSQFDARPLLQELKASAGRQRNAGDSGQTFDIAASISRVRGFGERVLSEIDLNYASDNGRLAALSVAGRTGNGGLRIDLSPREGGQAIRIATEDLGAFIGFVGLYGNMEGGSASLDVVGAPNGVYDGVVTLQNFTLVDEPRLERFVGSEPVAGQGSLSQALGQDLRTSRAYFDQASAVLRYGDGRLSVSNGILRGPVFGSSFAGTLYDRESRIDITGSFMPAYNVNRLFGAIPLVGRILGNGIEGGLLGITYQLSGAFASPSLTVNPISLIAPGVFRQIFEY